MEEEKILSGYCRQLDAARMVAAVTEEGKLTEVDCAYPNCTYAGSCTIARQLMALEET